jgi:hypothetical protein
VRDQLESSRFRHRDGQHRRSSSLGGSSIGALVGADGLPIASSLSSSSHHSVGRSLKARLYASSSRQRRKKPGAGEGGRGGGGGGGGGGAAGSPLLPSSSLSTPVHGRGSTRTSVGTAEEALRAQQVREGKEGLCSSI